MNLALAPRVRRLLALLCLAAAPAAHADIVIGQVAPFTGPQAVTGKAIRAGAKLWLDEVNARGGIKGQKLKLVTRDDGQKPEETVRLVKELIEQDNPTALIGTIGTTNLEALKQDGILEKSKVSMLGAVSGATSVVNARNMYPVKATYREEVERLFKQLGEMGRTRVGLVYQDDGLGRDAVAGAQASAKAHGLTLVAQSGYARNTTEVGAAVNEMVKQQPEVIFLAATTSAAIEFTKRYQAAGGRAGLYGMSIIDVQELLAKLGPDQARGFAFSITLPTDDRQDREVMRDYARLRQGSKDADLSARSVEGFIAAKALTKALERSATLTAAGLSDTLERGMDTDIGGHRLSFGKGQATSKYVDFAILGSGGRLVR
ncbi:ABC transporter substrate-binding protein [Roseateles terrae]|uniref:ABC-type branched-subunit amino acid transport system substrate-binding protein n=1 Tax=Roseateles terrae TaxID=431060 RepID=A0ABR6GLT9_9BURK|nr:ABC transporter substrate-binding protein [Roseateles terrae]MBB3193080.1 ABC-type branched-subunit amino acid transport system substrate-binding protein [Roseateles terrae]OWQ89685.1 amino acid-binding protein [Roseateles terrae]